MQLRDMVDSKYMKINLLESIRLNPENMGSLLS